MIKCTFFDLDGTLADTLTDLADSCNYALTQLGYPTFPAEAYKMFVGNGAANLMRRILPQDRINDAEVARMRAVQAEYYAAHCLDNTRPYPGIPECIAELKRRGISVAVMSNKPDEQTRAVCSALFGEGGFDAVSGKRADYPVKPDPALILKLAAELGMHPGECAMIGDSGVDMQTAANAGMTSIGVTWGFRGTAELRECGAQYIVHTPEEIPDILTNSAK